MSLTLRMEKGARSTGMLATSRDWKGKGADGPLESLEEIQPDEELDLSPGKHISDF